jgi:hypothetical protein
VVARDLSSLLEAVGKALRPLVRFDAVGDAHE